MTQIVVDRIFPLNEGAKSGSLKSTEGKIYKFLPWQLKFITVGAELDVPIVESEYNGQIYLWFAKTWPPKDQQNEARIQQQPGPQRVQPPALPAQPASNGSGYAKDVQIATIALMKSFIETGNFGLTDLDTLMLACVPIAKRVVDACK